MGILWGIVRARPGGTLMSVAMRGGALKGVALGGSRCWYDDRGK